MGVTVNPKLEVEKLLNIYIYLALIITLKIKLIYPFLFNNFLINIRLKYLLLMHIMYSII